MKTKSILASAFVLGLSVSPAFALGDNPDPIQGHGPVARVPEIDAAAGFAALAAVAGGLAFAWERRRSGR